MELIFTEKIKLSEKERKAFDLVHNCCSSIMKECRNYENSIVAENVFNAISDFYDMMDDDKEPTEEEYCWEAEYCEEEHCWDERHIPTQFELNP